VTPGKAGGGGAYPNGRAAGRRKNSSGQWHSPVGRELRWVATVGVWSCSIGVRGGSWVSSNLGMVQLGGCSPERGKTAVALGEIRREGEASGGRRRRSERGSNGEGDGARGGQRGVGEEGVDEGAHLNGLGRRRGREGKRRAKGGGPAVRVPRGAGAVMGPGLDRRAAPGSGPRPAGVRHAVVAGRTEERRRGANRWAAAQCRAVVPLIGGSGLSAARRRESHMRGRAWASSRRKRSG
jgi:hypothetical protein